MAKSTADVILALRNTANTLKLSKNYQWGHMGACNCGFLAQQVTALHKDEIHSRAWSHHTTETEAVDLRYGCLVIAKRTSQGERCVPRPTSNDAVC